jgi:hypothetical protein
MNKRMKTSQRHSALTLGDLIVAVSSVSRNSRETAAAVTDLMRRGRVGLSDRRWRLRIAA